MSIIGYDFIKPLHKAGLIPDYTKRVVIDIPCNDAVMIYYETYASQEMIDIAIESLIQNKNKIKAISVEEISKNKQEGGG